MINTISDSHEQQTVTLKISAHLVKEAKRRGIDLSKLLEKYLCQELGENGPDFCEAYANEVSNRQSETENLNAYFKEHGPG